MTPPPRKIRPAGTSLCPRRGRRRRPTSSGGGHARSEASRGPRAAGFTLIELLTVIGIIAVLAGIVFPVFAQVRGKARQTTCQSNLRQIGMALQMYAQDYDGFYPWAKDASDQAVPQMWDDRCRPVINVMPLINDALDPYARGKQIWRCTSDTGFDYLDNNDSCNGPCYMPARPTMFEKYGASYLFRTEIAFRQRGIDTVSGWRRDPQTGEWREVGLSEVNVLFDGNGSWHGGGGGLSQLFRRDRRYITLFADGRAKLLTDDQYQLAWRTSLTPTFDRFPCQ
jgi:general secretion pathway protein G